MSDRMIKNRLREIDRWLLENANAKEFDDEYSYQLIKSIRSKITTAERELLNRVLFGEYERSVEFEGTRIKRVST